MRLISAALLCCLALPAQAFDGLNGVVSLGYVDYPGNKWDGTDITGSLSMKHGAVVGQLDLALRSFAEAGTATGLGLHLGTEVAPGTLVGLFAFGTSNEGYTQRGYGIEAAHHRAGMVITGQFAKYGFDGNLDNSFLALGIEGRVAPRVTAGLELIRNTYAEGGDATTITGKLGYDITDQIRLSGFVSKRSTGFVQDPTVGLMIEARLGDGPAFDSPFDW